MFHFLIGTLKTIQNSKTATGIQNVSIPYRHSKNIQIFLLLPRIVSVSIPYRHSKNDNRSKNHSRNVREFQFLIGTLKTSNKRSLS